MRIPGCLSRNHLAAANIAPLSPQWSAGCSKDTRSVYFLEGCGRGGAWREVQSSSIKLTETLWIFSPHFNQNLRQLNAIASTCSAETRLWPPYSPDSAFCKGVCVGLSQAFLLRLFCLVLIVTEPQKDWRGFLHILVVNQAEQGHASGSLTCHINFSHKRITDYLGFLSFYFFNRICISCRYCLILPQSLFLTD